MTARSRSERPALRCSGLLEEPGTWSWEELFQLPGAIPDLGVVAEGFTGGAIPLRSLFERIRPTEEGAFVTVESDDGFYRASIPLEELRDKGWLALSLEGEPLPRRLGGPMRVVVPQGETLCWNVKAAFALRCTAEAEPDSVPADPSH